MVPLRPSLLKIIATVATAATRPYRTEIINRKLGLSVLATAYISVAKRL